jgi:NTE family protein
MWAYPGWDLMCPGVRIQEFLRLLTKGATFADLDIPRRDSHGSGIGRNGRHSGGNEMRTLVRASISIPGVFQPVELNGRRWLTGQVTENLPVTASAGDGGGPGDRVDVSFGKQRN